MKVRFTLDECGIAAERFIEEWNRQPDTASAGCVSAQNTEIPTITAGSRSVEFGEVVLSIASSIAAAGIYDLIKTTIHRLRPECSLGQIALTPIRSVNSGSDESLDTETESEVSVRVRIDDSEEDASRRRTSNSNVADTEHVDDAKGSCEASLRPVFIGAFSDGYASEPGHLPDIADEHQRLSDVLREHAGRIRWEPLARATCENVFSRCREFRDEMCVFHFAGHADGYQLFLAESDLTPKAFAEFLKDRKRLQLVFLNGCSTQRHIEVLHETGVPVVIATSRAIKGTIACEFAASFYKSLVHQATLERAFSEAVAEVTSSYGQNRDAYFRGSYELINEDICDPDGWPWIISGSTKHRGWQLGNIWGGDSYTGPVVAQPFVGLRAFEEDDAYLFFGREQDRSNLLGMIQHNPLAMVVGGSGSGKSSLVQAGLIPAFRNGALDASDKSRSDRIVQREVIITRPKTNPFEQLAHAVGNMAALRDRGPQDCDEIRDLIRSMQPTKIMSAIVEATRKADIQEADVLLVIDQFEELFSASDVSLRTPFIDTLLYLAESQILTSIRIVLTMRYDYYNRCREFSDFYHILEHGDPPAKYVVRRMDDHELATCIQRPLELAGCEDHE